MDTAPFSVVTAITPAEAADRFTAEVSPEWTIGGHPNGGYLLAILGRAAIACGAHDQVLAASAHYVSTPEPGRVEIEVETLRTGRSASQARTRMLQGGRLCVESLITTTSTLPAVDTKPFWSDGLPRFEIPAFADSVRLPGQTPTGMRVAILDQVDLRLDPATMGFAAGRPSGRGELRGWLALPAGAAFDSLSLLYAVDAFPPGSFEIEMTGWVPTFELTVYVRATPAPGPVQVLQKVQLIDGQRLDEACYVWDSTGRLVAHGTQLAGIRLG
jgi:hypothetical protein